MRFRKWQRKDDVTPEYRARFEGTEGVLYIGKAQEKARVMRTERRPRTHRYQLTDQGLRTAMFYTRAYHRILRPGLALLSPDAIDQNASLHRRFTAMSDAVNSWCDKATLAA